MNVMLNLFQYLFFETLKQVQGDGRKIRNP